MKTKDVIEHFGGIKELSWELGIWPNTVYGWGEEVPRSTQFMIQVITDGKFIANRTRKPTKNKLRKGVA